MYTPSFCIQRPGFRAMEITENDDQMNIYDDYTFTDVDRMKANRRALEYMLSIENNKTTYLHEIKHQLTVAECAEKVLNEIKPIYIVESSANHPLFYNPGSETITRKLNRK